VLGLLAVAFTFLPLMSVIGALMVTRIAVQFIGQIAALVRLRRTQPELVRPFKMWLYPLPAFIALAGWLFLMATTDPTMLTYGACVIAAGLAAFLGIEWKARRWPFGRAKP
jgi:amino acid transporter